METLAAGVWRAVHAHRHDAILIAYGGANRGLPRWIPVALARLTLTLLRRRAELVLTGDALMYAVTRPLLRLFRVRHATMIMGLDVTYQNRLYRAVVLPALRRADTVVAISEATAEQARGLGVPADRITVLRLGVDAPAVSAADRESARAELHERLGLADGDVVLLTLGRLVARKGAAWFVEHVLPRLPAHVHYVLAGDGPDAERIETLASTAKLSERVHLLGRVSDADREMVMRGADLFIQPNVKVPGDMEGFGLVTIESAMRGTPVVAADLEGIKDAVINGTTGDLVASGDAGAWATQLESLLGEPSALRARGTTYGAQALELYGEQQMSDALWATLGRREVRR
jgi:glycosyltransferase involved in cell wall biosynthesis